MAKPAIGRAQMTRRGVLVAAAGTLFTAACGADESNNPGPTTRGSEELIIGASLELTGPGAAHGVLQERHQSFTSYGSAAPFLRRRSDSSVPPGWLV
ncbi:hypothetical protein AB0H87_41915, partial [Asanoa sp. NPDC050611]